MISKIPLPTDNIYKFYALFGLLLIIFSLGTIVYISNSTNKIILDNFVEYKRLKSSPVRSAEETYRLESIEIKMNIAKSDEKMFFVSLFSLTLIGLTMMIYGFRKWHTKIQPLQDQFFKLHKKKIKLEIKKLKKKN